MKNDEASGLVDEFFHFVTRALREGLCVKQTKTLFIISCPPCQPYVALNCCLLEVNSSDDRAVRGFASGAVDSGLIPISLKLVFTGQTIDIKIGIHSFPAGRSALKGQCEEQANKFPCCAVGKGT